MWIFAAVLAIGHFFLANLYSNVIPYRQPGLTQGRVLPDIGAPDERAHANLVQEIMATGKYPIFDPRRPDFSLNYQAHQPPLYYIANVLLLKSIAIPDVSNPQAGNAMRLLNSLFGALNILATVALGRFLTGNARIALGAGAIIAFIPMNLSLSGTVNNDVLLFALATSAWATAAFARIQPSKWWLLLIAGVLSGLAILTKTSGMLALPITAIIALWPTTKDWRPKPHQIILAFAALAVTLAIATPWWNRNYEIYGELFLTNTFTQGFRPDFGQDQFTPPMGTYNWLSRLVHNTQDSATGVFGYFDIHYPERIPILAVWPVLIIAAIGLAALIGDKRYATLTSCAIGIILFTIAYLAFNMKYAQPQARYLFPGLPLLAIITGAGLQRITPYFTAFWLAIIIVFNFYTLPWLHVEYQSRISPSPGILQTAPPFVIQELEFYRNLKFP